MGKSLVIGYGNAYCHDDGVALHVINELRRLHGLNDIQPDQDGLDDLGHDLDSVMLHQLVPEMVPIVARYGLVFFVDAHLGGISEDIRVVEVQEEYRFHAVSHHMSPGMVLKMVRDIKGVSPRAYLISIKGENFDFGFGLSEQCKIRVRVAVQKILDLARLPSD